MSAMDYIRNAYNVPAKRGVNVVVDGQRGRITSAQGCYIMVRFEDKKFSVPCHPTWRVEYEVE